MKKVPSVCSGVFFWAVFSTVFATAAWAAEGERSSAPSSDLTQLSLEELMNVEVYGASKFQQKLSEAPSSVSVVTADEIKKYGYRNLADVLRSVRGFIVTNDRAYSYVTVRGFGRTGDWNSRVLILVDGHRMNEITYDAVYVANEAIVDIDLVDRIEIIRGPSSSLYGDNAFFAVISITTKQGPDIQGTEVSAEAGNQATYAGRASFGKRLEGGDKVLLSASAMSTEGNTRLYFPEFDPANPAADSRASNNGIAENLDKEQRRSAFAKYSTEHFTFEGAYVERTKKIPIASFSLAGFNDPRFEAVDSRAFLDVTYKNTTGPGIELLGRLYYDQYWYHTDYPYAASVTLNKDYIWANWWGAEAQIIKKLRDRHTIVAGADFQNNVKARFENYDIDPYLLYIDSNRRTQKWSLFLQDESRLSSTVILNAGVRYDKYETFGDTTNPRAALIYTPIKSSVYKFLYGTAFRSPNQYELYFDSPTYGTKGNPDLDPETISTYEIVYEQRIGDNFTTTISGFYNRIKNLIVQETDPADSLLVFHNHDGARAYGIEAEIEGKWQSGLRNRLSYTYTPVAKDTETHQPLPNSPRNMVKGSAIIPVVSQKLFVDLDAQYIGRRGLVSGGSTGSVVLVNATLFTRSFARNLDVSASVYNLFDRQYGDPGGEDHLPLTTIQQDGRTYRVKLTYAF
jgi:outer membrane receptor for ferrienterochelin and colicins